MSVSEFTATSLSSNLAEGTKSRPTSIALESHQTEDQGIAIDEADSAEAKSGFKNDTILQGMFCVNSSLFFFALTEWTEDVSLSPDKSDGKRGNEEVIALLRKIVTLASTKTKTEDESAKVVVPKAADPAEAVAEPSDAHMYRTRPMIRDCDWHEFKNRYPDEGECCAIETLLSSRDLGAEIEFEQLERKTEVRQRSKPRNTAVKTPQPQTGNMSDGRLERVRINSAFILAYLAKVTGERSWERKPHSFLHPFKIFIHYHSKMVDEFNILRQNFVSQH